MGQQLNLLAGKVIVVTGGATGIGEAMCKVFARHGARVVVNGYPGDPVDEVVGEIVATGGAAIGFVGDVGAMEGATGAVRAAIDAYGRLDGVVANAGIFPKEAEVHELPMEDFEQLLHTNVRGTYNTIRAAIPELRKTKGSLVTISSEAAIHGLPKGAAYCATKGFVYALTRAVAAEQGPYGVRANVVCPGPIDTEMTRPSKGNMSMMNAFMATRTVPLGRRGTPEEVANVALFLLSDLSTYVNGGVYTVDGGATASAGLPGLMAKGDVKHEPPGTVPLEHQHEGRTKLS